MSLQKEKLIDSLLNETPYLKKFLKDGRYMSIGANIYKATAQLSTIRGEGGVRKYFIHFVEVGKDFVKDIRGAEFVKEIYKKYNYDYEYPVPCNLRDKFEFVVDGVIWNSYKCPVYIEKEPIDENDLEQKCPKTLQLFRHIYQENFQLALDYMVVEFMYPTHPLPVQVLYSRENNTGKSTVLFHRREVYGKNAIVIDSGTFEDKFNAPISFKNFIGIDEGKLRGENSMEKIKSLVTSPTIQYRAMRKAAIEIPNFSKWAIATNKDNFAKLDLEDSRFWVIKVPLLKTEYEPDFMYQLKKEIPYWIGFLKKRWENRFKGEGIFRMRTPRPLSRLWFLEDQYSTDELAKMKRASRSIASKNFLEDILEWFDKYNEANYDRKKYTILANVKQLKDQFYKYDNKINTTVLQNILERDLVLKIKINSKGKPLNCYYENVFDTTPIHTKIRRRNVYELNYFDLIYMRDGIDVRKETLEQNGDTQKEMFIEDDDNNDDFPF